MSPGAGSARPRRLRRPATALAFAALAATFVFGAAQAEPGRPPAARLATHAAAAGAASCPSAWTVASALDGGSNGWSRLMAVAPVSANDAWAVGDFVDLASTVSHTLVEHWNGTAWSLVNSPNRGTDSNYLTAAKAVGSGNVWAVGWSVDATTGKARTLVEHWNGTAWSIVNSPNSGLTDNRLYGVDAVAADDIWAVGYRFSGPDRSFPLALHWDGTKWSLAKPPGFGLSSSFLYGVRAVAPNDVWAVGRYYALAKGVFQTLVEHWDGSSWTPSNADDRTMADGSAATNVLMAVDGTSSSTLWAVGYAYGAAGLRPVVERLGSGGWTLDPLASSIASLDARLFGLAVSSKDDVWAIGSYFGDDNPDPLMLHWDGTAWSSTTLSVDQRTTSANPLFAIGRSPAGDVWATGARFAHAFAERICPMTVRDTGFSPTSANVGVGGSVAWKFPAGNATAHSVADASPLGLFDSGLRQPGGSYTATYAAAGTYPVADSASSATATIKVVPTAAPAAGHSTTNFTVTWASEPATGTEVYDVQIKRPGAASYVQWRFDQTDPSATFTPDAGLGAYSFRARLRDAGAARASDWSPPKTITVS